MSRIVAGLSLFALTTLTGAALSVAGCSDDGGTGTTGTGGESTTSSTGGAGGATSSGATSSGTGGAATMDVVIPFEGRVGKTPFACKDTYPSSSITPTSRPHLLRSTSRRCSGTGMVATSSSAPTARRRPGVLRFSFTSAASPAREILPTAESPRATVPTWPISC